MDDLVVSVRALRKRYGDLVAVDGASFDVFRGEILGILGPNGSGKTTTVECVQGLRRYDAGEVRVLGLDPRTQGPELRRRIGCQLQEAALPDRLRVWEALDLFASLAPDPVDWRELLGAWGLAEKRNASFRSLSGGQRQRLFVALALVGRPELVFLDEMTTGLDPAARRTAWELIDEIRDGGTTVVLVTHFMDEAERLCDRIVVLHRGSVVVTGTPAAVAAAHGGATRLTFSANGAEVSWLDGIPGVTSVERHGPTLEVESLPRAVPLVAAALVEHGVVPDDLHVQEPSLEDAFLELVGTEE